MAAGRPFHGSFVAIPRSPLCSALGTPVIQGVFCQWFGSQFGLQTNPSNSGSRLVGVWCIVANKGVAYREVPYIMCSQSFLNFAPNITLNPTAHPLRGRVDLYES